MKPIGVILILVTAALPAFWFAGVPEFASDTLAVISQYIGSVAIILMAWSQFLATRMKGVEAVFGAQDRIYVLHKWLGIVAMVAVLVHDTVDAELRGAVETLLVDLGETLGEVSLYGILVLITITLVTFVPYRLWRWTHRFMGAFFAMSAIHYLLVPRPFELTEAAGMYVSAFCFLGVAAYLYTLIPFGRRPGGHSYIIDTAVSDGGACVVSMSPVNSGLVHRPGQFAFIRFENGDRQEIHPFSISMAPNADRNLRFTIRPLGDFTEKMAAVAVPGSVVSVDGPYGRFLPRSRGKVSVWIAAGVGVTPFVAWAQAHKPDGPPVHFYYCVRDASQAPHLDELRQLAATLDNFELKIVESAHDGRLTAARLSDDIGAELLHADIFFCGPTGMRKALELILAVWVFQKPPFTLKSSKSVLESMCLGGCPGWLPVSENRVLESWRQDSPTPPQAG